MSNDNQPRKLVAAVSMTLPNRKVAGRWMPGAFIKAKQVIPTDGLDQSYIDNYLKQGLAYYEGTIPLLKDVKAMRPESGVNVSAVQKGDSEENPLDDGIDLKASENSANLESKLQEVAAANSAKGDRDPALEAKLAALEAEQSEEGVEVEDDDVDPETERKVEVNAETGEVTETGGDPEMDDEEVDAQVG